jgi:hypothetical protein
MPKPEETIAWNRKKAEETLAIIATVMEEAESPSRDLEVRILQEAHGRYIMTAEMLESAAHLDGASEAARPARIERVAPPQG